MALAQSRNLAGLFACQLANGTLATNLDLVTGLSDDRKLAGLAANLFFGRVVDKLGRTKARDSLKPFSEWRFLSP